jgi:hypothetical protein
MKMNGKLFKVLWDNRFQLLEPTSMHASVAGEKKNSYEAYEYIY